MPKRNPIEIGSRFGRLIVISEAPPSFNPQKERIYRVLALCDCGNKKSVAEYILRSGRVKSCGCWNVDAHVTHGQTDTPAHVSWYTMRNRCENPNNKDFPRYGAVGIKVCARWSSFENFLADMGERPKGTSIDRYPNPHGDYEPTNCRWATPRQQAQNRRRGAVLVLFKGEETNVSEAARHLGIDRGNLWHASKRYGSYQAAIDHFVAKGYPTLL